MQIITSPCVRHLRLHNTIAKQIGLTNLGEERSVALNEIGKVSGLHRHVEIGHRTLLIFRHAAVTNALYWNCACNGKSIRNFRQRFANLYGHLGIGRLVPLEFHRSVLAASQLSNHLQVVGVYANRIAVDNQIGR